MEAIDKEQIKHIARLAELELDDKRVERFVFQIDRILGHVATISKVDTKDVRPTAHTSNISNIWREDIPKKSFSREESLSNAPQTEDGGFKVPKID